MKAVWKQCKKLDIHTMVILLALIGLISLPLLTAGINKGHDLTFHLFRIEGIASELSKGQIPVRISSLWLGEYGYPVSIYYGDFLLYIPAVLRLLGVSVISAYKLYVFGVNVCTVLLGYFSFLRIFNNKKIALVTCVAYATATYRLVNVYVRAAVGEYTAMTFFPVIVMVIYRIYTADYEEWKTYRRYAFWLALCMTGLIGTHLLSTEIVVFVMAIVCMVLWKKTFRKNTLRVLALAVIQTLIFNLYFLVPMIDYYVCVPVKVNQSLENALQIQHSGAYIAQYFSFFQDIFGYDRVPVSERFVMSPGIVLMMVLIIGSTLWLRKKASNEIKFWIGLAIGVLYMGSNMFPWNYIAEHSILGNMLAQVQFPWRYLGIACIVLSVLLGCLLEGQSSKESKQKLMEYICGACLISTFFFVSNYSSGAEMVFYDNAAELGSFEVGGAEYVRQGSDISGLTGETTSANIEDVELLYRDGTTLSLYCKTGETDGMVDVPLFNYKGYCAKTDQGDHLSIMDGENNVIRIVVPAEFQGNIMVYFSEPWYWTVALVVSLCGLGLSLCFCAKENWTLRQDENQ